MRTKNGKRIGPVPIALAVFALAAALSVGLWLVPGSDQTAEAQGAGGSPASKCVVTLNDTVNPDGGSLDENRPMVSMANHCFVTGNTATVEFTSTSTAEVTRHIYTDGRISGGTNLKVHLAETDADAVPATAITSYMVVKIPAMVLGADEPGKTSITVSRNGKPHITIAGYDAVATLDTDNEISATKSTGLDDTIVFTPALDSPNAGPSMVMVNSGVELEDGDDEASVTATFMDSASATFDMVWNTNPGENTIEVTTNQIDVDMDMVGDLASFLAPGAKITVSAADGYKQVFEINDTTRTAGTAGTAAGDPPVDGEEVTVTASLSRNVEGMVTLTVGDGADVMLEAGLAEGRSLTMTAKQARSMSTGIKVVGIPEEGNVRIAVTAEFSGDTGILEEKGYAIRSNDVVDSVSAMTYSCKQEDVADENMADDDTTDDVDESENPDPSKICVVEARASTKVSDLTESNTFAPGSKFVIIATVVDSAGNPLMAERITARQADGPSRAAISATAMNADAKGMARLVATIKGEDDADGGTYSLRVARGTVTTMVDVNVAGDVTMLSFPEGMQTDPIPANTGVGSFTVRASDVNGNLPINVGTGDDGFEALISVRPSKSQVLGDNKIKFSAKTGEATFFVQVSDEAELGDSLVITVTAIDDSSIAPAVLVVTYGEADGMPTDPGMDDELGTPMNVVIGFNNLGALQVSWDQAANANGYFVYAINTDITKLNTDYKIEAADGDEDTVRLLELTRGDTYDVYVAATGSGGANTLSMAAQVTAR